MKAAICDRFGQPQDVVHEGELPIPEPKDNQVLIKTSFGVIHNHNMSLIRGQYGYKPPLPYIGGSEGAGTIVKVGSKVKGYSVGDRVNCTQSITGTWAEYFLSSPGSLVKIPSKISDESAAQLIAMPISALMLLDSLALKRGEWFVYNCANGLVGQMLASIARARGVNMVKIVRSTSAKSTMEKQGFSDVVATSDKDWRSQVKKIVGKSEILAGVDNIGGHASSQLLSLLSANGTLVVFGNLSGKNVEFKPQDIIFANRKIRGYWAATELAKYTQEQVLAFRNEIVGYVADGRLVLPVGGVYGYNQMPAAFDAQDTKHDGKVLIGHVSSKL